MTAAKPKVVGTIVDVPEGGKVTRPDGTVSTVTGGSYVLDEPGTFVVDDQEVVVE
ncbi:hypothetical protein GCM10027596_26730 [Nocardioides korecus]